eukprot:COSAG04_NODE_216_length_19953_cov_85.343558_21_plen_506_part_00
MRSTIGRRRVGHGRCIGREYHGRRAAATLDPAVLKLCFLGRFAGLVPVRGEEVAALDLVQAAAWPIRGRAAAERHPRQRQAAQVVGAPAPLPLGRRQLAAEMMKPARLLPYLAVALATALLVVAGVVTGWHTAAAPDAAALRRELLEGVVPAAAHEQLRERVARQDIIIAELVEDSKEMGASVRDAQESAETVQSTVDEMGARLLVVEGALSEEEGEGARRQMMQGRRRAQANSGGRGAEQANSAAVTVKQFSIDVLPTRVAIDPAGGEENGHRRAQAASCTQRDIATRSQAITTACCTEEGEDCSGGLPSNCNADCAHELLPFWEDCEAHLGAERAQFEAAAGICQRRTPSLAEQLNVECADGRPEADCVPRCNETYHGYQLLLNIGGEDSKMSCQLHHELYSWIGGAVRVVSPPCCCLCPLFSHTFGLSQSDGGYLGSDFQAFFSAVVSGAAGVYVGMLVEDAGISTDLVVTPGQSVSVVGDPSLPAPAWCVRQVSQPFVPCR